MLKAAEALLSEFAPLDDIHQTRIAERLTSYVLTGENEDVLKELTAMSDTHWVLLGSGGYHSLKERGLHAIVKHLPQDPQLYLRLARVCKATVHQGNATYIVYYVGVPAFRQSVSWLEPFMLALSNAGNHKEPIFPVELLVAMIESSNGDANDLIRGAFFYEDAQGKTEISKWRNDPFTFFQCLTGFAEFVLRSPEVVRPAFHQKDAASRACVLRAFGVFDIALDPFVTEIAALSVSGSKEVREKSGPLVKQNFPLFKSLLEDHAVKGSADERYQAVRLLAAFGGDAEQSFLQQRLDEEKSGRIVEALRDAVAGPSISPATSSGDDFGLPPVPEVAVHAPLDKEFLIELRRRLADCEQRVKAEFEKNLVLSQEGKWTLLPPDTAEQMYDLLQNLVVTKNARFNAFDNSHGIHLQLLNAPVPPQFELIHFVRWCLLLVTGREGEIELDPFQLAYTWRGPLESFQKVKKTRIRLRELAAVFRAVNLDDCIIGRQILESNRYAYSPFLTFDPDGVWPYFAERLDLLEEVFGLKPEHDSSKRFYLEGDRRRNAFGILRQFPRVPETFVPLMWEIAFGSSKTERLLAQECLDNFPNKEQKIIAALASRQQDVRFAAAQWLAALQHKEAIPALRAALAKEKSDGVREEMIKALEMLGVPLDELIDISKLDKEAEQGLKKGIHKDLEWFPFAQLPPVTWADSRKPVSTDIIHWFLVQGYKLKNAEPTPTLRRYCSLFQKQERETLGKFVLEAWIAKDTKPKYTAEEAAREAERETKQAIMYAKQNPQYYPDFDEQRVYQAAFNLLATLPEGSETKTKGILAVAGACCGGDVAPVVHRYVKQWYGQRVAQCKALLQVLVWIDDPNATQVVLTIANRFRTKGIQEEAARLCQMLADRKGWTMDELADRTIPTAGFDENGILELDYGARKFTATLSDEMSITVTNQSGKVISSLPDANQSDDAEQVKLAKAALATARKELKSVLSMQKDRFYEALCTQRSWRFEDWDTHLRQHPIVGRYCQRLVWVAYDGEKIVESFRPLADGTLTNHQDDQVTLDPETPIRLGHEETLPAEDRTAWLQHLSDYEIEPLFQQFGKPSFTLPDDMKDEREIKDFLGHLVKAFTLRTRLTRLGYTRGASEDGGWFYEYRKTFLSLGIEAVIQFTGNPLPEENRMVALERLYFMRKTSPDGPRMTQELALGELPRVLLSECWNDIRMAAADGPGFAEDWQKQTEY